MRAVPAQDGPRVRDGRAALWCVCARERPCVEEGGGGTCGGGGAFHTWKGVWVASVSAECENRPLAKRTLTEENRPLAMSVNLALLLITVYG